MKDNPKKLDNAIESDNSDDEIVSTDNLEIQKVNYFLKKRNLTLLLILLFFILILIIFQSRNSQREFELTIPKVDVNDLMNPDPERYKVTLSEFPVNSPVPPDKSMIGSISIRIEEKKTGKLIKKISKPIEVVYKYDYRVFNDCLYEEDEMKAYVYNTDKEELSPLRTEINKTNKTVKAYLTNIYPNNYNETTDILILTPVSKVIWGCGETAAKYHENGILDFPYVGYTIKLQDPSQKPEILGVEGLTTKIPLPKELLEEEFQFYIYTTIDSDNLPTNRLDEVTYGYEMIKPEPFIQPEENIINKKVDYITTIPVLMVNTESEKQYNFYIFMKNPYKDKEGRELVYIMYLYAGKTADETAVIAAREILEKIAESIRFVAPTII